MVSIKNVSVKKIVKFKGHEGEDLVQCDVYYKGKKVGFFSQDNWGGADIFNKCENSIIDLKGLDEIAQQYINELVEQGNADEFYKENKEYYNNSSLILDIVELNDYAKIYNKNLSKGFDMLAVCKDEKVWWQTSCIGVKSCFLTFDIDKSTKEVVEQKIDKKINFLFCSPNDFAVA